MRALILVAASLLCVPALHAQAVEIYGTLNDINANNIPDTTYPGCPVIVSCQPIPTHVGANNLGIGGGVTVNILRPPVLKLGVDLRASHRADVTNGTDTALAGLKLTIHPPIFVARPYLQGSVGYIGTTSTTNEATTKTAKYLAGEVMAGLDLPVLRFLDLRAIELGVGHAVTSTDGLKPTFLTLSAGLVVHF